MSPPEAAAERCGYCGAPGKDEEDCPYKHEGEEWDAQATARSNWGRHPALRLPLARIEAPWWHRALAKAVYGLGKFLAALV